MFQDHTVHMEVTSHLRHMQFSVQVMHSGAQLDPHGQWHTVDRRATTSTTMENLGSTALNGNVVPPQQAPRAALTDTLYADVQQSKGRTSHTQALGPAHTRSMRTCTHTHAHTGCLQQDLQGTKWLCDLKTVCENEAKLKRDIPFTPQIGNKKLKNIYMCCNVNEQNL